MAEERTRGIDVSHYQGKIDWQTVAGTGISFAFIKATDGLAKIDPKFEVNWRRAQAVELRRGAYHFFHAQQDSERQAQVFLAMLRKDHGELPPVLDFETLDGASVDHALCGAKQWMEIVENEIGKKPILYTGPAFWTTTMGSVEIFADHPLWIAHYTDSDHPNVPQPWRNWAFWQKSEKGLIAGIKGPVDLDIYVGTVMELDASCERIHKKSAAIGS
ncbi:MAG TPA: GH25 family lysozyme [Terriglobales bacterium]|nr:GH25 family lysozyme [Terriglobales bacterium]